MRTETLVEALRQFRDSNTSFVRMVEGSRTYDLDLRAVLLLAAEQFERSDTNYIALYRRLVERMQAENYELLYERLMGERIPKELQT